MQTCGSALLAVLESSSRDLAPVDLYEFYQPSETRLEPAYATRRYAADTIFWHGWEYERQVVSRGDVSRFIDGRFNNVSLTFSNIDRSISNWLSTTDLEGWRVVIRMISRSVDNDSVVLFVGRCEPPYDVDNTTVSLTIRQDLGSIDNELPWSQYQPACPLRFKGVECLAGQMLGQKNQTYQSAMSCNKTWAQCSQYGNTPAFQGFRFNQISTNFKKPKINWSLFLLGPLIGTLGILRRRAHKNWSSQDETPYGKPVPIGAGRTQIELQPVNAADTGEYLYGHWIVGEGAITSLLNVRNVSSGWADWFQAFYAHFGNYGYNSLQPTTSQFLGLQHYSHRAYVEATIKGDNPDTGDSAPTLVATVLWSQMAKIGEDGFTLTGWSDNPVEQLRWLLTEERSLNYDPAWIDDEVAADTARYCNDPLIDQTGCEDIWFSSTTGTPGTDFKRYRSTGLLDIHYWRNLLGLTFVHPAEQEIVYQLYSPASPPSNPTPTTWYRKRYTSNWHLRDALKATDFIFKSLLPSFRGYLITGADGRLQIRSKRPTVTGTIQENAAAGSTSIEIDDAAAWRGLNVPVVYSLVGAGLATSETRRVTAVSFSVAGNTITLAAVASGSIQATRSGPTFTGGSASRQAVGTVTFSGTPEIGDSVTVTIDGQPISYTLAVDAENNLLDTTATVAAMIATMVNADATLSRYIEAVWTVALPNQVLLRSKLGILTIDQPLTSTHDAAEIVAHVHLPFSDAAFGALGRGNILRDSFRWPLSGKQASFNQFTMIYNDAVQDYQATEVRENDYEHQDRTNRVSKFEISGSCVDNYHQADRLVRAARYEMREGNFFCSLNSTGLALLLEEGDIICVTHSNMPGKRNLMLRVEELRVSQDHQVALTARLYADEQFPESATARTIVLTGGGSWLLNPPGAVTNLNLTTPAPGTLRGVFQFSGYLGSQIARIELMRAGESGYYDTGLRVSPNANGYGYFELSGLPAGVSYAKVTAISSDGSASTPTVASIEYTV